MVDEARTSLTALLERVLQPKYRERAVMKVSTLGDTLSHDFAHKVIADRTVDVSGLGGVQRVELWRRLARDKAVTCVQEGREIEVRNVRQVIEEQPASDVLLVFDGGRSAFFENEAGADAVHWVLVSDTDEKKRVCSLVKTISVSMI